MLSVSELHCVTLLLHYSESSVKTCLLFRVMLHFWAGFMFGCSR